MTFNARWLSRAAVLVCFLGVVAPAMASIGDQETWFRGYSRTLKGGTIDYRSCQPDAKTALIVRSLDAQEYMEWETESVPADYVRDSATFVWVFGLNANLEARSFDLSINNLKCLTFSRPPGTAEKRWFVNGIDGTRLEFRVALVDKNDDLFGYAFLTVPQSFLTKGKPLSIRVHGQSAGSRAWYMTFQRALSDTVVVAPQQALLREGGGVLQPVAVEIVHLGVDGKVRLRAPRSAEVTADLRFGFNRFFMKVPAVKAEEKLSLDVTIDTARTSVHHFVQKPIRTWTVYLVQHAHTDIGYTRPQTDILPEHLRFIDYALDYCDQTDRYPEDARFRWTCEASWPVREYLKSRPPAQIERLKKRVREGRVEITGMMFNMSELADETAYTAYLQPILRFKQMGFPVCTAMQDDVNGAAWCLIDYFQDIGVKYLTMGQNAARALKPFNVPTSFWWESPSGKRLLVFRADHYMTGNFMALDRGSLGEAEPELFDHIKGLEDGSYPYDRIAVQYSGYLTDNSAPSTLACDVIQRWNEKYIWPRLRNSTVREFPQYMEKEHGRDLPVFRAAWPDWWTDGVGSAARETAAARRTQAEMIANQGLFSMARLQGSQIPAESFVKTEAIYDDLLFYDEHTFGAAESISDPRVENSMVQWAEKSAYAWDAVKNSRLLRETALGLLQAHLSTSDVPTIAVFNTLNWTRSGLHTVYIDNQILPPDQKFRIVDLQGKSVAAQLISRRADGSTWGLWVEDIPAMGFKTYRIEVSKEKVVQPKREESAPGALENAFYRLTVDTGRGAIGSLYDKELNQELLDHAAEWSGGQFIYETLTNREQLEQLKLEGHSRTTLKNVKVKNGTEGDIWKSLVVSGQSDGYDTVAGVTYEIRLYKKQKRIELHYSGLKLPVTSPEAVYVAFPFSLNNSKVYYEAQGGTVIPGDNQLPGSSSDWHTIQNFVSVRSSRGQIILGSDEIPLVQFGGINTGKFQRIAKVEKPHVFSWVLNNYWTTNFLASQEGELKWSYYLTSTGDTSNTAATRFGWGARVPFVSRVLPAGTGGARPKSDSFLDIAAPNILLISTKPARDGSGIVVHLREVEGRQTQLPLSGTLGKTGVRSVVQVNVHEERLRETGASVQFNPFEIKFLKFILR